MTVGSESESDQEVSNGPSDENTRPEHVAVK